MDEQEPVILARWRTAGEWWLGEPQTETVRYIDKHGVRREVTRELPSLGDLPAPPPFKEEEEQEG